MVSACALFLLFFTSGNDGAQSAGSHLNREDALLVRKNKFTGSFWGCSCAGRDVLTLCFLSKVKSHHQLSILIFIKKIYFLCQFPLC